jgi:hypothetical protein
MNDLVWYSRFAVLVGALVLLVQSVSGRGVGFVTLLGILLLCFGFLSFVAGLALQGMRANAAGASTVAEVPPPVMPEADSAGYDEDPVPREAPTAEHEENRLPHEAPTPEPASESREPAESMPNLTAEE